MHTLHLYLESLIFLPEIFGTFKIQFPSKVPSFFRVRDPRTALQRSFQGFARSIWSVGIINGLAEKPLQWWTITQGFNETPPDSDGSLPSRRKASK